jgi:hypothetical protein
MAEETAANPVIAECETPGSLGRPGVTAYVEAGDKLPWDR